MDSKTGKHPFRKYWSPDDSVCEICGTMFGDGDGVMAEMFHPADEYADLESVICHYGCGSQRGLEMA